MSVVQTRPRISGVAIAACSAASGLSHAQQLTAAAGLPLTSVDGAQASSGVQPFAAIASSLALQTTRRELCQSADASRAHAASVLAACRLDRPAEMDLHVRALASAPTAEAALAAHDALLEAASAQHRRAFVATVASACARAASSAGFTSVETGVRPDGTVRVVSTDEAGRALVSEIVSDASGEPTLATEVIGVHDGSCHGLLDRFDEALVAEGVRSAAPERRETGGAALLETAREVARRALRPTPAPSTTSTGAASRRRARGHDRTRQR